MIYFSEDKEGSGPRWEQDGILQKFMGIWLLHMGTLVASTNIGGTWVDDRL